MIGPVLWIKGFFIRPAISWNLNFDDRGLNQSSKSWTGRHISIGYHPGWGCREIAVAAAAAAAAAGQPAADGELRDRAHDASCRVRASASARPLPIPTAIR